MMKKTWTDIRRTCGMTLVEMMVAIGITSIVMALSVSIFMSQQRSYQTGKNYKQVQQSGLQVMDVVKYDLLQAGWSVLPQMAFFIQDGGTTTSDMIVVNDASVISLENQAAKTLAMSSDCPGGLRITSGANPPSNGLVVPKLDINGDSEADFKGSITQYIITDNINITAGSNKIAVVNTASGTSLGLDRAVGGTYVAPGIFYCVNDGVNTACSGSNQRYVLRRSDRATAGRQPIAENIVDMQVAYLDTGGNWYGQAGCAGQGVGANLCTRVPFDPRRISLLRLSIVTRNAGGDTDAAWVADPSNPTVVPGQDPSRMNDPNYCRPAVENRTGAAVNTIECGFVYRTYTVEIQPRSTGPLYD